MACIVRRTSVRKWPVTVVQQVGNDDGTVSRIESTFVAHWKPFSEADIVGLGKRVDEKFPLPVAEEGKPTLPAPNDYVLGRNAYWFTELIAGWGDEVKDEETNQSIPYSPKALTEMITGPDGFAFSAGFSDALNQLRYGIAPAKNVETSPSPGPAPDAGEVATSLPTT